ncbi:MAG: DNA cytosine methyltransferase [candidate division Zixibacteria bacterium]|nr:DNA cytosine methyltransferase [candidate division Zixibacteria bacterium]
MRKPKTIDLFCGGGGSSWGAVKAGAKIVAAFDKWDVAVSTYKDNFPGVKLYSGDLTDFDPHDLKEELGKIDLILASPECTNHSPAKGNSPRCEISRETSFHVIRFAEALHPRWIVIENVVSMRKWARYHEFLERLKSLGYHCREQILNAADFAVPQTRRRLFILCDREIMPRAVPQKQQPVKGANTIVSSNGAYPFRLLRSDHRAPATLERAERAIAAIGARTPFLIVYYGSDHAGGWQPITRPLRTITTLDRFAYVKPTADGHVMRMLQPEELKLAMGWPKCFRIKQGTRRDKIKVIGNAVSPKVMAVIIKTLLNGRKQDAREKA